MFFLILVRKVDFLINIGGGERLVLGAVGKRKGDGYLL